jgi:hypothetical protein
MEPLEMTIGGSQKWKNRASHLADKQRIPEMKNM